MRSAAYLAMQRLLPIAVCMSLLFVGLQSRSTQVQRALLTVDGLGIPVAGALAAFRIDTWGVDPLAVCKVPPLWGV
jgi:hypothetical protein